MKRKDLEKKLISLGWRFLRHGGNHDVWTNGEDSEYIPRHREISEYLARKILRKALLSIKEGNKWDYKVKFGKTASYGEIAKRINNPKAVRAVGGANRNNRIPLIIPCHRIIGSNGKLTGYGGETTSEGGVWRKEWLLKFEGAIK